MEISFGDWEGQAHDEILNTQGEQLRAFWSDPERNTPPGGEPMTSFRQRIAAGWEDLLREHAGGHVLLVAHANVIRTVLTRILGAPSDHYYRLDVPKARVSRIRLDERRGVPMPRLLFHGARL